VDQHGGTLLLGGAKKIKGVGKHAGYASVGIFDVEIAIDERWAESVSTRRAARATHRIVNHDNVLTNSKYRG
jgi:hypothetical protein